MKKFLCFLFAFLFSISIPGFKAYAVDTNFPEKYLLDDTFSASDTVLVSQDISCLKAYCIIGEGTGIVSNITKTFDSQGDTIFTYTIDFGEIVNDISVINRQDESIQVVIQQGTISNTAILRKLVTSTTSSSPVAYQASADTLIPSINTSISPRYTDRWVQKECPYGVPSDYSQFIKYNEDSNIAFGNPIEQVAFSYFLSLLIDTFTFSPAGSLVANLLGSTIYAWLSTNYPYAQGLSFQANQYYHKDCGTLSSGYVSGCSAYVTKCAILWYSGQNFTGGTTFDIVYEMYRIY